MQKCTVYHPDTGLHMFYLMIARVFYQLFNQAWLLFHGNIPLVMKVFHQKTEVTY